MPNLRPIKKLIDIPDIVPVKAANSVGIK